MKKHEITGRILEAGLITIVRSGSAKKADKLVEAICKAEVRAIEVTLTTPGALKIIERLCENYESDKLLIGAGSVLDPETARAAILSGAKYIVTPNLNIETLKLCNRYGIPVIPGIFSPTEIVNAMEYGAEILKVFPGSVLGFEFVKAVSAPLPMASFIPTGGVELSTLENWFKAGAVAVAVAGGITNAAGKDENYEAVTEIARQFVSKVKAIKEARDNE